jgi:hypothetical protein
MSRSNVIKLGGYGDSMSSRVNKLKTIEDEARLSRSELQSSSLE